MPLDMDMAMAPFRYMLGDETNNVLDRMSSRTGGCGGGGGQGADSDGSDGSGHTVNGDLGGDLADLATGYDPENGNAISARGPTRNPWSNIAGNFELQPGCRMYDAPD